MKKLLKSVFSVLLSVLILCGSFSLCAGFADASGNAFAGGGDASVTDDGQDNPCANAKISVPVARDIDYRTKVTIKARATDVPAGYYLAIYFYDKQITKQEGKGTGITEVSYYAGELKSDINYTVKIIDKDGNVPKNADGKLLSKDAGTVKCTKSLFIIISAFFKGIFGNLPSVTVEP